MGLTSEAKRKQMDLHSPLYGMLTDAMKVPSGGEFKLEGQIHAKIEPEVAFYINQDLSGDVSREDILKATLWVAPALEILDSRYREFKYFSLEDVIADNSSSSFFVVGDPVKEFSQLDLKNLAISMSVNGQVVQEGNSANISGDPVQSVRDLCLLLKRRDQYLPKHTIVLTGAATAAHQLASDIEVVARVEHLGQVSVKVK